MAARPTATDRLGRILAMVPWIASQDGPRIDAVCERFDIGREELLADLNVVFVVGLYPYTPDNLIEVDFDDDHVWIRYTNFFERPLRLSKEEALALLAAGIASAAQPGHDPDGPLARGLAKVAAVLGIDLDADLAVVLGDDEVDTLAAIDAAIEAGDVLHIGYFSHARNEGTERDVEPRRRFAAEGAWYLDAWCRATGEQRVFRVDRITSLAPTGEHFEPSPVVPDAPVQVFTPPSDVARVTIEVPPSGAWVAGQYPVDEVVELDGGRRRITLAVTARPWLERLLLRLGPEARVVDGPDDLVDAGPAAARRLLTTYRP
jgi:proteasome accessory factor C